MRKNGAKALALDPQASLRPDVVATAEAMPFAASSFDGAIFFNSLHHVPRAKQARALAEAARVLCAGAPLLVVEPLAEGTHFTLLQPLDDETEIRAAAAKAVDEAKGFERTADFVYPTVLVQKSVNDVIGHFVAADPDRASLVDRQRAEVERRYRELGRPHEDGVAFDQPMRLIALRRRG